MRIVERILAKRLYQCTAVGFIDIAQMVVRSNEFIHFAINILVRIVRNVQGMHLHLLTGPIRKGAMTL